MSVITSFKFYNDGFPGVALCQSQRAHYSFRSGADKTDFFYVPVMRKNDFRQLIFLLSWSAKRSPERNSFQNFFFHLRVIMTENQRPPRATEIYELVSVSIINSASL